MDLKVAKQNLLEIKEILDRLKIKFWLLAGTLLGAVREKDFIPWDYDMDITILARDWRLSICEEFTRKNFYCGQTIEPKRYQDKISAGFFNKRDVRCDALLSYYYPPEDIYIDLLLCPPSCLCRETVIRPAKFYRGDHFIDFLGASFRVPYPPEECVEWIYGKNWRIPKDTTFLKARKTISLDKYLKYFREHPTEEWLR